MASALMRFSFNSNAAPIASVLPANRLCGPKASKLSSIPASVVQPFRSASSSASSADTSGVISPSGVKVAARSAFAPGSASPLFWLSVEILVVALDQPFKLRRHRHRLRTAPADRLAPALGPERRPHQRALGARLVHHREHFGFPHHLAMQDAFGRVAEDRIDGHASAGVHHLGAGLRLDG
jgi:hypothetical protein